MSFQPQVVAAAAAIMLGPLLSAAVPDIPLAVVDPTAERGPTVTFPPPRYSLTAHERELVASCLVLEAASQGEDGMRGVMAVIRNRAHQLPALFAPTVLREKQFSALNSLTSGHESASRVIRRARQDRMWPVALTIVDEACGNVWYDPTGGATHYTRTGEHTRWTRLLARTVVIGRHAFYR